VLSGYDISASFYSCFNKTSNKDRMTQSADSVEHSSKIQNIRNPK